MTFMFNEGMPRSGKSFDAVSRHIAKALRDGRPVDAHVHGLDHGAIAYAAELPPERVAELLQFIPEEDVMRIPTLARKNALVVIDELQNYFPTGRQKLSDEWTKFITMHGHRGIDILGMGQVFSDVHKLWRGRCKNKFVFNKLDAVGMENRYNVQTWTATAPEKFIKTSDEIAEYDKRWFGTYASHEDSGVQTGNYKDSRASLWNTKFMRWGLPAAGVALVWGAWTTYQFFSGSAIKQAPKVVAPTSAPPGAGPLTGDPRGWAAGQLVAAAQPIAPPRPFIVVLNEKYRARLAGYHIDKIGSHGIIEWWNDDKLVERLTFDQIRSMGSSVDIMDGLAKVGGKWVTRWPLAEDQPRRMAVQVPNVGQSNDR